MILFVKIINYYYCYYIIIIMGFDKTLPDKLTDAEKKKKKQENKAKANPQRAADNKEINDRKRENRMASGSKKVINR